MAIWGADSDGRMGRGIVLALNLGCEEVHAVQISPDK